MKLILTVFLAVALLASCSTTPGNSSATHTLSGQMPNVTADSKSIHIVYGNNDTILYSRLAVDSNTFSKQSTIAILPHLAASHSRGPQIASNTNGLSVIACNNGGNIFSYYMDESGKWSQGSRVNDVDTVAKEGLMALAADGNNAFAVWLDLRSKNNQLFGAKSADGGKTWSKNILIYASPDTTVCECCKPSVVIKGNNVYVMFRNWLNGNRDMYLIQSADGGDSFSQAQKLGNGSWKLNGCPMDGGGVAVADNGTVQTVWRRESKIYSCQPGTAEKEIGDGKSCTLANVGGKNAYAWTENGKVICMLPNGKREVLGNGKLPVLKAVDDKKFICVWENEKQIHSAVVKL